MGKKSGGRDRRPVRSKGMPAWMKWAIGFVLVVGLGYGLSTMSGVPYDEKAIGVVDFSGLTASQKKEALQAANRSRCPCGCGMNTAQCVATDSTCPLREDNIKKIRTMVREAGQKG